MSIFVDESVKPKSVKWDTDADFSTNLKKIQLLFFDLRLRNKVVTDKPEYNEVAEKFVAEMHDLTEEYEIKIKKIQAKRYYAIPKKLTKDNFIQQCVAILKQGYEFNDKLGVIGINEQQLATERGLLRCMREFSFAMDITVDVNFENFEVEKIVETKIGIFLLCVAYGDWEHPVYFYAYLSDQDPDTFFTYVPLKGNYWDIEKRRAFENDGYPRHQSQYDRKAMLEDLLDFFWEIEREP